MVSEQQSEYTQSRPMSEVRFRGLSEKKRRARDWRRSISSQPQKPHLDPELMHSKLIPGGALTVSEQQ